MCDDFESRFCCPIQDSHQTRKRSVEGNESYWEEFMQDEPIIPTKIEDLRKNFDY